MVDHDDDQTTARAARADRERRTATRREHSDRRDADPTTRAARAFLTWVCRGVPSVRLAELIAEQGPVTAAAVLAEDHRGARTHYGAPVAPGDEDRAKSQLARAAQLGARLLVPEDSDWPAGAATLGWHRPDHDTVTTVEALALWVRGPAPLVPTDPGGQLGVVGSRAASAYGHWVAQDWATQLTDTGTTIITGGGLGIDAAATRGALAARGAPIVVAAAGVAQPHPSANHQLVDAVAAHGAIVSPFPLDQLPSRSAQRGRLRLLASLATHGLLVVEAGARSSALDAARAANDDGAPVLVVPGPVTSATSVGTHRLAREPWARIVGDVDDVRADMTRRPT